MFVAVLFVLFKRKMQRKTAQKKSAESRYVLNKNCSVFFVGRGVQRAQALCARVQGAQLPCAGQGRQPLPREVMPASLHTGYCLTLESAGLAAKLPFSQALLWEKMKGNALPPACRRTGIFRRRET